MARRWTLGAIAGVAVFVAADEVSRGWLRNLDSSTGEIVVILGSMAVIGAALAVVHISPRNALIAGGVVALCIATGLILGRPSTLLDVPIGDLQARLTVGARNLLASASGLVLLQPSRFLRDHPVR